MFQSCPGGASGPHASQTSGTDANLSDRRPIVAHGGSGRSLYWTGRVLPDRQIVGSRAEDSHTEVAHVGRGPKPAVCRDAFSNQRALASVSEGWRGGVGRIRNCLA